MDNHTLRVLEFNKILNMGAAFAVTAPGRNVVQDIRPLKNTGEIRRKIELVSECRKIFSEGQSLGIENFGDLLPLFQRIRPADAVLEPLELTSFLPFFYSVFNLRIWSDNPSYPGLGMIVSELVTHPDIKKSIEGAIDREGKIRDNASPELSHIRRTIKTHEKKIKEVLEEMLKRKDLEPHLQDYFLAERNNRWVIPVKRDSKGSLPGVVHDISNTGETIYVEPYAIQKPGNELESLKVEEKLEMLRILRMLSSLLRRDLHEIEEDYRIAAEVDALQALAVFADRMEMSSPEINEKRYMRITGGRHPLLWKTLKKEGREGDLVPLDMEIGRDHSSMIITGSNTGGKTVALKTAGVLNLMALSGMHTPSGSGTTFPFIENILADIGDDQSIEENLSTFSAHIKRISDIISQSNSHTLVIIDELGTGTDPEQGGALSCAILRKLKLSGALTVVSTHLGRLKAFAHAEAGLINSAMEMEEVIVNGASTYRPTYKLVVGEAGTSHAFEVAESLGLQGDVIREAKQFMSGEGVETEALITELKRKTGEINKKLKEAEGLKEEAGQLKSSLEKEVSATRASRNEKLSNALKEAEDTVRRAKAEAHDIIKDLRKQGLSKASAASQSLNEQQAELKKKQELYAPKKAASLTTVRKGQRVFINSLGIIGIVDSVDDKNRKCKIEIDGKEIMIPLTGISEAPAESSEEKAVSSERPPSSAYTSRDLEVAGELNIVGQRVDPALSLIERYLNDASMAGLKHVRIIHGVGEGILSRAVREFLTDHPLVEEIRKGNENEGGEGVTIASI